MLAQVVVDLGTCFLIALIAARLAPPNSRRRVALAGLWLAALCPFIANYSAVVLTEILVTFLTALALLDFARNRSRSNQERGGRSWSLLEPLAEPMVACGNRCRVRNAGAP